jgi:hypothetical protein
MLVRPILATNTLGAKISMMLIVMIMISVLWMTAK